MAKFRRHRAKRKGGFFSRMKRGSRKAGVGNLTAPVQIDAMAYGALRGYTSNLIAPFTTMIPLGQISDELGMGIVNYLVAKNTSGMIRNIAIKGLIVENARIGDAIVNGGILPIGNTAQTSTYLLG